ncbi:MAG: DUF4159 domain-containing protein [Rhodospirillaceae bacterium]
MLTLGPLAFTTPWMLGGALAVPALWWLVRLTPPAPRLVPFPALRLLRDLTAREETPAGTPPWLLALRLAIALLLILGLAGPLWHPVAALPGSGPLVLVIDDGWSAAAGWPARLRALSGLLARAEREDRPVVIATTAPAPLAVGPLPPAEARRRLQGLEPKPWPVDRRAALTALQALALPGRHHGVWLCDGLGDAGAAPLIDWFRRSGGVLEMVRPAPPALLLRPPLAEGAALAVPVLRAGGAGEQVAEVRLLAGDGRLLAREPARFAAGALTARAVFTVPGEVRNQAVRASLEGEAGAGATVLLDERWRRRPVGLVSGRGENAAQPLLSDLHYLEQALAPFAEVRRGGLGDLLASERAVLILADVGALAEAEATALGDWVSRGGLLLRFAGPRLAQAPDALLPVRLRPGGRVLGGALTWEKPAGLAPFEAGGPFAGLAVPPEVTVSRQVLAEPGPDTAARSWARLADGTPLITGLRRRQGSIVLVHTTAGPEWSTLALSGLYLDLLRRLVALSAGVGGESGAGDLAALETLDGLGRPGEPPPTARPIAAAAFAGTIAGPSHPPGFYGTAEARRALNLGAGIAALAPLPLPPGLARGDRAGGGETDLEPPLLLAALLLLVADLLVGLRLRGLAGLLLAVLATAGPALAAGPPAPDASGDITAEAAARTWLAYVETGDPGLDATSRAGLEALAQILVRRTAVDVGGVAAVDPERSELAVFPLLYWPVPAGAAPLSAASRRRVGGYLGQGGLILFDGPDSGALSRLCEGLDLPPLTPVPGDHALGRAFYLLGDFPGRNGGGEVWVEAGGEGRLDGVSSVVVGGNDWAGAWAADGQGRPLHAMPGGERQREIAYRFGVNLVIYALTGNYKTDQVHVPAILERLGR